MAQAYDSDKKRAQLVTAASNLLHEQGFHRTTLADVAKRARVPLGNIHYYFKTKDALAHAVITGHESALQASLAAWSKAEFDPRRRLRRLVLGPLASVESVVRFGCPHGSLCFELKKRREDHVLAKAAGRLLDVYIDWCAQQFAALGFGKGPARELAVHLIAAQQGILLLAHSLRSRQLLSRQLRRLAEWVDEVAPPRAQQLPTAGSVRSKARAGVG